MLVNWRLPHASAFGFDHLHQPIHPAVVVGVVDVLLGQKTHLQGALGQCIKVQSIAAKCHRQDLIRSHAVRFAHHIPGDIRPDADRSQEVTERARLLGLFGWLGHPHALADFVLQFLIANALELLGHHSDGADHFRVCVGRQLSAVLGRQEVGDAVGPQKVADGRRIAADKPRPALALAECDRGLVDRLIGGSAGLHRPGCRAGRVPGKPILAIRCRLDAPVELTLQALALTKPALRVLGCQVAVIFAPVPDLGWLYSGR